MTLQRPEAWGKLAVQQPVKQASSSDSEEDLLSIEEMQARKKRKEEEKKLQLAEAAAKEEERLMKRKLREKVLRDARARAAAEDDDSDLEIEGRPSLPSHRRVASTPKPGTELDHVMRDFAGVDPSHHYTSDDDPTDSQVKAAGKEFGHHLGPNHHFVPSPAANRGAAKRRTTSKAHQPVAITQDSLSRMLVEKAQRQSISTRLEKMSNLRKQQMDQGEAPRAGPERLDVQGMLEKKKKQQEEQKEEEDVLEEMDDPDYQAGFDEGEEEEEEAQMSEQGDEDGSGSDAPVSEKKGAQDLEEGEFDSEGELIMPLSSQNSDRLGGKREVARQLQEEDDDEDAPIARRTTTVKPRVVLEEDEEEEGGASPDKFLVPTVPATVVAPTANAAPAPVRMMLDDFGGGDDGGGFSQFFDSQFDQGAPGAFEVRFTTLSVLILRIEADEYVLSYFRVKDSVELLSLQLSILLQLWLFCNP